MCLCRNHAFVYMNIHEIEVHNNGNTFIKSCWFIIKHVLHSYGFHLVSTYKYDIGNCLFYFMSYLWNNHLSFLELRQNNMAHLNWCLLLNVWKAQQCRIQKLNPFFLFDLHQFMVTNEHQHVKMALNASMGGLWRDFITIFWIIEYLQRLIYIGIKYQNTLCLNVA
jgi:hypothetical protein